MTPGLTFHDYADMHGAAAAELTQRFGRKRARDMLPAAVDYYRAAIYRAEDTIADHTAMVSRTLIFGAEAMWHAHGRPYYHIYPDYAAVFAQTKLDVPMRFIHSPFPAFSVAFARGEEPRYADVRYGPIRLQSMLVMRACYAELNRTITPGCDVEDADERRNVFHVITRCEDAGGVVRMPTCYLYWTNDGDTTVASRFDSPEADEFTRSPLTRAAVSIALSVAFLATGGDRLIEPDVLNGDFAAYLAAVNQKNAPAAAALADKSQRTRNGRPGFTVGRAEALLGRRTDGSRDDAEVGGGYGLAYQHQRKGHFHKYWAGPARDQLTVKWVSQVTVRPDLPLPPESRYGARSLRDKKEEAAMLAQTTEATT